MEKVIVISELPRVIKKAFRTYIICMMIIFIIHVITHVGSHYHNHQGHFPLIGKAPCSCTFIGLSSSGIIHGNSGHISFRTLCIRRLKLIVGSCIGTSKTMSFAFCCYAFHIWMRNHLKFSVRTIDNASFVVRGKLTVAEST